MYMRRSEAWSVTGTRAESLTEGLLGEAVKCVTRVIMRRVSVLDHSGAGTLGMMTNAEIASELPFAGLWDGEPAPFGLLHVQAGLVIMPALVQAAAAQCILETSAAHPAVMADEYVLDLGCGEGGLLIELARLPQPYS